MSQGVLVATSSGALGSGPITVAGGAQLGVGPGATISNSVTLTSGSGLVGTGTFALPGLGAGGVVFGSGTSVMPGVGVSGNYIGALSFTTPVTFGPSGAYILNLETASGIAGTDYGTLNISGTLTITATPTSKFEIDLVSVATGGGLGPANFNALTPYSWTLATTGGIVGFNANNFFVNASGFQNSLGGGSLIVGESGNDLTLNFTPVPEPEEWMLLAAGFAVIGASESRRYRRSR